MAYKERKRILFFGLPWTFTTYQVTEELITTRSGILRRIENDCYMYKIVDVRLETSLLERLFGLGTVHCFGGDVTDPDLLIRHIRHAREIKDLTPACSEDGPVFTDGTAATQKTDRRQTMPAHSPDG